MSVWSVCGFPSWPLHDAVELGVFFVQAGVFALAVCIVLRAFERSLPILCEVQLIVFILALLDLLGALPRVLQNPENYVKILPECVIGFCFVAEIYSAWIPLSRFQISRLVESLSTEPSHKGLVLHHFCA